MDFAHNVFGLVLRSNLPIPGLPPLETSTEILDIQIHLGISPPTESGRPTESQRVVYTSSYTDEGSKPIWEIRTSPHSSLFHLTYCDGMQFWLDRSGKVLWAVWPPDGSLEGACSYLLGPVLGMLLRLRGTTCLHASAVTFEGFGVALAGPAGAGKSTTAAAFARQGCAVISDDIVALEERQGVFQVMPAYPHLCLWPDSVQMLYGFSEALPRIILDWDKRRLAVGDRGTRFDSRPLPLRAIYLLGDRTPDLTPYVEAVPLKRALLALVANSFATTILDRDMRAREFAVLGRLVNSVPIRRIFSRSDTTQLDNLCRVIREDYGSLGSRPSAGQ